MLCFCGRDDKRIRSIPVVSKDLICITDETDDGHSYGNTKSSSSRKFYVSLVSEKISAKLVKTDTTAQRCC